MGFLTRAKTDLSNHLASKKDRRHSGVHTVTTGSGQHEIADTPRLQTDLPPLQFSNEAPEVESTYKPIFSI